MQSSISTEPSLSQQLAANFTGTEGSYSELSQPPQAQAVSANPSPQKSSQPSDGLTHHSNFLGEHQANSAEGEGRDTGAHNESIAAHSEITFTNDLEDGASMSGYSAGRADSIVENLNSIYYTRLVRFYERYNPEKIPRAEEFLSAYKGDEEQLFKTLSDKYGPEPDLPRYLNGPAEHSHHRHGQIPSEPFHFIGPKAQQAPERVLPIEGRTEVATPYWPLCKTITDRDVLDLFLKQKTDNSELRKCYIGFLNAHPHHAWNGMTYLTSSPLPQDASKPFLGHIWSGTLANNKTLLYKTDFFRRTVLHCTEECQRVPLPPPTVTAKKTSDLGSSEAAKSSNSGGTSPTASLKVSTVEEDKACPGCADCSPQQTGHRRWRLVIYHTEVSPYALFRVMFDPVMATLPVATEQRGWPDREAPSNSPPPQQVAEPQRLMQAQNQAEVSPSKKNNFFTFSFSRKAKQKEAEAAAATEGGNQRIPDIKSNQVRSTRQDARNMLLGGGSDRSSSTTEEGILPQRRGVSPAQRAATYRQPTQPIGQPAVPTYADAANQGAIATQAMLATLLHATEERIMRRLDSFEGRLGTLEAVVGTLTRQPDLAGRQR